MHGTGSSLACPDWPLCHGQFFPEMSHGVEYEHGHRLSAAAVSTLTVLLSIGLLRSKAHRHLRGLAIAAPIMVLAQALLGGLTVIFKLPTAITLSHLTLSMCFFSVTVMLAIRTRPSVMASAPASAPDSGYDLRKGVGATAILILAQILMGGLVRHRMAGLACLTFPWCFGHVWPPESTSSFSERIHMLHRFGAVLVAISVCVHAALVFKNAATPALRRLAIAAPILITTQITLGVFSVTSLLQLHTVTAHLGCGALVLATVVSMWTLLPARSPARVAESARREEAVHA